MRQGHLIYLLRHAKSSWDDPALPDIERPLSPRGRKAAASLKRYFKADGLSVDLVLCSPARRTRDTWASVSAGLRQGAGVEILPAIYEATADELLEIVRGIGESARSALLLGHNPGLAELAAGLVGDGEPDALDRLRAGFPTGALAAVSVGSAWADVAWGRGYLERFVRPRDLPGR